MGSRVLRRYDGRRRPPLSSVIATAALLLFVSVHSVEGWGSSSSSDMSMYSNNYERDWLSDGSTISMKIHSCVESFVTDGENAACMEEDSDDGTTSWYMMSNCKRANVVYSLYTGGNCNNFQESFISTEGLPEFIYLLQTYDPYSPWSDNGDDGYNDDGGGGDWDYDNLPMCEGDNGYVGLGCSGTSFVLEYFDDAYCLSPSGSTYDSLNSLNNKLSYYSNCATIYQDGYDYNAAQQLIAYSTSCSSLDSGYCSDSSYMSSRRGGGGGSVFSTGSATSGYYKSWGTKAKYVMGGLLLLAAFIMFTGILFTNRRRRRALLQRKFRQRSRGHRSRRSSKSRSKSRDGRSSSSRKRSSRSRSASARAATPSEPPEGEGGVLT